MGVCDLCAENTELGMGGEVFSAEKMRRAVHAGLRPEGGMMSPMLALQGVTQEQFKLQWVQQVMSDSTDWALCPSCAARANRFLTAKPAATGKKPAPHNKSPFQTIKDPLPKAESQKSVYRPGCVTAYALLIMGVGAITGISALAISGELGAGLALMMVLIAALQIAVGIGLWQMRNWARVLLLVGLGLAFVGNIGSMCQASMITGSSDVVVTLISGAVGLAIIGGMFAWFKGNGTLFS